MSVYIGFYYGDTSNVNHTLFGFRLQIRVAVWHYGFKVLALWAFCVSMFAGFGCSPWFMVPSLRPWVSGVEIFGKKIIVQGGSHGFFGFVDAHFGGIVMALNPKP